MAPLALTPPPSAPSVYSDSVTINYEKTKGISMDQNLRQGPIYLYHPLKKLEHFMLN